MIGDIEHAREVVEATMEHLGDIGTLAGLAAAGTPEQAAQALAAIFGACVSARNELRPLCEELLAIERGQR